MNILSGLKNANSFAAAEILLDILNSFEGKPAEFGFEAFSGTSVSLKLELLPGDVSDYLYFDGSASASLPFRISLRMKCRDSLSSENAAVTLYSISDFLLSYDLPFRGGEVTLRCVEMKSLPHRTESYDDGSEIFCMDFVLHYYLQSWDGASL